MHCFKHSGEQIVLIIVTVKLRVQWETLSTLNKYNSKYVIAAWGKFDFQKTWYI